MKILLPALALVVGLVGGWWLHATKSEDPVKLDPPGGSFKVVALGDSYISGEGAKQFFIGTDVDSNRCRRAPTAYPYLLKRVLNVNLVFAACSGAKTADILTRAQYPESPQEYGNTPQIEVLEQHLGDAELILLQVGGNDAKFGDIGQSCALRRKSCTVHAEEWIANLKVVESQLVDVYSLVKETAPNASLFVMNYPNPFAEQYCAHIPTIKPEEYSFLRQEFIPKLNAAVSAAAEAASVQLIDLEDAFLGRRICEVDPKDAALNILAISRRSAGDLNLRRAFYNSFHPNALGHTLLVRVVSPLVTDAWARSQLQPWSGE